MKEKLTPLASMQWSSNNLYNYNKCFNWWTDEKNDEKK